MFLLFTLSLHSNAKFSGYSMDISITGNGVMNIDSSDEDSCTSLMDNRAGMSRSNFQFDDFTSTTNTGFYGTCRYLIIGVILLDVMNNHRELLNCTVVRIKVHN